MMWAVIPSRNRDNLSLCLRALFEAEPDVRACVVDDGLDGRPLDDWRVEYVAGQKPFVFARNINIGIRHALSRGAQWLVLLNDDALIAPKRVLSSMVDAWLPGVGIAAPATTNTGNRRQWPKGRRGWMIEPRMICFVCVLMPAATVHEVGLLDERFCAYGYEDDDYCLRVRRAGLQIAIWEEGCVRHELPSTFRAGGAVNLEAGAAIFREKWGMENWQA